MKGGLNLKVLLCSLHTGSHVSPACPSGKPNVTKLKGNRGAAAQNSCEFCVNIQFVPRSKHSKTEDQTINKMILRIIGSPSIHYVDRRHRCAMLMQLVQYTARSTISTSYTLQTPPFSARAVF
jgi:hypothetical protein